MQQSLGLSAKVGAVSLKHRLKKWLGHKPDPPAPIIHEIHNTHHGYLLFTSPDRTRMMGAVCVKQQRIPKAGDIIQEKTRTDSIFWGVTKVNNYGQEGLLPCGDEKISFVLEVDGPLEAEK